MLRWLGFWAQTEQADSRLPHRPDVRAHGFTLPLTHFEVHVSHPARGDVGAAQVRRGSSTSAHMRIAGQITQWNQMMSLPIKWMFAGQNFALGDARDGSAAAMS